MIWGVDHRLYMYIFLIYSIIWLWNCTVWNKYWLITYIYSTLTAALGSQGYYKQTCGVFLSRISLVYQLPPVSCTSRTSFKRPIKGARLPVTSSLLHITDQFQDTNKGARLPVTSSLLHITDQFQETHKGGSFTSYLQSPAHHGPVSRYQ